jgi:exodeoxyribonuclease VII large subunit
MARQIEREIDLPLFAAATRKFLSVTELNELIKDDKSQICAVMFRRQGGGLRFLPENGLAVLCFGKVSLYSVRGDLQLYVDDMEPQGQGALYLAFEQLKKKLAAEGLFAQERKKPLPFLPATIGIVSSDRGAALHDMLRIIRDRYADRRVVIRPVRVQGEGAAKEIAEAIADLNCFAGVEAIIVGRGGGSLEDLWAFNEEIVARAIYASKIPVVSAVGHEIDFTIADFVADHRAPTPTAAAEFILPRKRDLLEQIQVLELQLLKEMEFKLETAKENLNALLKRLTDPGRKLRENQQRLDELSIDLLRRFQECVRQSKNSLMELAGRLSALSPLAVLERGYAIAHKLPGEQIVKSAAALQAGDLIRITFAEGQSFCRVEEKK